MSQGVAKLYCLPKTAWASDFGNFSSDLKFFNLDLWNVKWDLYGHEWGLSNHLTPSNPWLNAQLTTVDHSWLSRVSGWLNNDWRLLSIQSLAKPLQNDPRTIWAWKINPRALSQWKWHLLVWLTDSPDQLDLIHQLSLHLGKWTMQCYAVDIVNAMT